jgi:hypothetical protein
MTMKMCPFYEEQDVETSTGINNDDANHDENQ